MNGFNEFVLILAGLIPVGIGLRESQMLLRMHRVGIRSTGVVLRHQKYSGDAESGTKYAPVIRFVDEEGGRREFVSKLSRSSPKPAVGNEVAIVYLPGRPQTAQLHSIGYRVGILVLTLGIGTVFLAMAVFLRP